MYGNNTSHKSPYFDAIYISCTIEVGVVTFYSKSKTQQNCLAQLSDSVHMLVLLVSYFCLNLMFSRI